MQLQVIVNKLNKRKSPVIDFADKSNIVEVVNKDTLFESTGEITNLLGKWYKDQDGYYYWEKGLSGSQPLEDFSRAAIVKPVDFDTYINERFDGQTLKDTIDYNFLLNVDIEIKATKGRGVTIAILDSPINKNVLLRVPIFRPENIDHPADTHGTFISGIIAGASAIGGVAPDVKIIEVPIRDQFGNQPDSLIAEALKFFKSNNDFMIVNVSQRLPMAKFSDLFNNLNNKIIIAPAGMNSDLQSAALNFPANLKKVISVGSVSKDLYDQIDRATLNNKIDFIIPDFNYVSYSTSDNDFKIDRGDSYACAVLSGVIGLLFSSGKINTESSLDEIKQAVVDISQTYTGKSNFDFLNIINPKS